MSYLRGGNLSIKTLWPVVFLFVVPMLYPSFSYIKYLTPEELKATNIEQFVYNSTEYSIVYVQTKPFFLLKKAKDDYLLVTEKREMLSAINQYAYHTINYSMESIEYLITELKRFNESIHKNVTVAGIALEDPFMNCTKVFGISLLNSTQCNTKESCNSYFYGYCVIRGCDSKIIGEHVFNYLQAGRTLLSKIDEFEKSIYQVDPEKKDIKQSADEMLAILSQINTSATKIKNTKLRYPYTGISECPDCFGICGPVLPNYTSLFRIGSVLEQWKKGLPDTNLYITFFEQGLQRVKKKDLEKVQEKLNGLLFQYEVKNEVIYLLSDVNASLSLIYDFQLYSAYSEALKAKNEVLKAIEDGNETTFETYLEDYKSKVSSLKSIYASHATEEYNKIISNERELEALYFALYYANSNQLNSYKSDLETLEKVAQPPIEREKIPEIIGVQERYISLMKKELVDLKSNAKVTVSSYYSTAAFGFLNPLLNSLLTQNMFTPQQYIFTLLTLVSSMVIFSVVSTAVLTAVLLWYGVIRRYSKNKLIWKTGYFVIVGIVIAIISSGTVLSSFFAQGMLEESNILIFSKAVEQEKGVLIVANYSSDSVLACAQKLGQNVKANQVYLYDLIMGNCYYDGQQMSDASQCIDALKDFNYAVILMSETAGEPNYLFTTVPRPFARFDYTADYYAQCPIAEAFRHISN